MPHILTIKSLADSLKYQLFDENEKEICSGCVDEILNHQWAVKQVLRNIKDIQEIIAVGHYLTYSQGEFIKTAVKVDEKVLKALENISESNSSNVAGIRAIQEYLDLPQAAIFDTAFFIGLPVTNKVCLDTYPLYGLTHQGAVYLSAKKLQKKINEMKIISCCLEERCSIAAIRQGKPIDIPETFSLEQDYGYLVREATFNQEAKLVLDMFILKIIKSIGGAYALLKGKVDAVVFSGNIFVNQPFIKQRIIQGLDFLGKRVKVLVEKSQEGLMMAKEVRKILKISYKS